MFSFNFQPPGEEEEEVRGKSPGKDTSDHHPSSPSSPSSPSTQAWEVKDCDWKRDKDVPPPKEVHIDSSGPSLWVEDGKGEEKRKNNHFCHYHACSAIK